MLPTNQTDSNSNPHVNFPAAGMLWFDDNPGRDLAARVNRAVNHYKETRLRFPARVEISARWAAPPAPADVEGTVVTLSELIPYQSWFFLVHPPENDHAHQ